MTYLFRLLFITCIQWIRGSSLSVNDIHTLSCTCTSLSITCILFSGCVTYTLHMYSYRLKLPSLLEHQVQVFTLQCMVTMYLLHANTLITVLGNNKRLILLLFIPLHVIKHCPIDLYLFYCLNIFSFYFFTGRCSLEGLKIRFECES